MRSWLPPVAALVLGGIAGYLGTVVEFSQYEDHFRLSTTTTSITPARADLPSAGGSPVLEFVNSPELQLGDVDQNTTHQHTFVVKNSGTGVLHLNFEKFSCGQCVQSEFQQAKVSPGETAEIPVTFVTRKPGPEFRESLEVRTNDPNHEVITLAAKAIVIRALRADPEELTLGSVSVAEGMAVEFQVLGFRTDHLAITEQAFLNPSSASWFKIDVEPLEPSEIEKTRYAKAGLRVRLTVQPGLPLGPINQTIRLTTDYENRQLEVPIRGTVVSEITLVGSGEFNKDNSTLMFGAVDRNKGRKATLHVLVKGEHRENVRLKIAKIDPDEAIVATLGEPKVVNQGAVWLHPLTVEVKAGSPIINRLGGTSKIPAGKIVIETTHPEAKIVPLYIRFATE